MPARDDRPQIAVVAVTRDGHERVVARLPAEPADLALVDRLARIAVACCRCGWRMRLRDVPGELLELLELCGLAGTLGATPPEGPAAPVPARPAGEPTPPPAPDDGGERAG